MRLREILTEENWAKHPDLMQGQHCIQTAMVKQQHVHATQGVLHPSEAWRIRCRDVTLVNNRLLEIVSEMFPERVDQIKTERIAAMPRGMREDADQYRVWSLALFNDHPATTWGDVDKVLHEYELRYE